MKQDAQLINRPESPSPASTKILMAAFPVRLHREPGNPVHANQRESFVRMEEGAATVTMSVSGAKLILRGSVRSWAEYDAMEWHAWSAPAITDVENLLTVGSSISL